MRRNLPTRHEMVRVAVSMEERGFDWQEWDVMNRLGDAGRPIRDYILNYAEDVLDMWEGRKPSRGHNASEIVLIASCSALRNACKKLDCPSKERMDELLAPPTPWTPEESATAFEAWCERRSKLPRVSPKLKEALEKEYSIVHKPTTSGNIISFSTLLMGVGKQ